MLLIMQVAVFNAISFFYGCQTLLVMLNTSNILLIIGTIITIVILVLLVYHIKTDDDKCDVTNVSTTTSANTSTKPSGDDQDDTVSNDTTSDESDSDTAPSTPATPDAKATVDATTAANSDENGESIDPQDYKPPAKAKSPDKPKKDTTDTVVETYKSTTIQGPPLLGRRVPIVNAPVSQNIPTPPDPQMYEPPAKAAKSDAKKNNKSKKHAVAYIVDHLNKTKTKSPDVIPPNSIVIKSNSHYIDYIRNGKHYRHYIWHPTKDHRTYAWRSKSKQSKGRINGVCVYTW